ncbi:hypothetical protein JCM11491_003246 [Sporobolomyces phaffii]
MLGIDAEPLAHLIDAPVHPLGRLRWTDDSTSQTLPSPTTAVGPPYRDSPSHTTATLLSRNSSDRDVLEPTRLRHVPFAKLARPLCSHLPLSCCSYPSALPSHVCFGRRSNPPPTTTKRDDAGVAAEGLGTDRKKPRARRLSALLLAPPSASVLALFSPSTRLLADSTMPFDPRGLDDRTAPSTHALAPVDTALIGWQDLDHLAQLQAQSRKGNTKVTRQELGRGLLALKYDVERLSTSADFAGWQNKLSSAISRKLPNSPDWIFESPESVLDLLAASRTAWGFSESVLTKVILSNRSMPRKTAQEVADTISTKEFLGVRRAEMSTLIAHFEKRDRSPAVKQWVASLQKTLSNRCSATLYTDDAKWHRACALFRYIYENFPLITYEGVIIPELAVETVIASMRLGAPLTFYALARGPKRVHTLQQT